MPEAWRRQVQRGELVRLERGIYAEPDPENPWVQQLGAFVQRHAPGRLAGQAAAALYGLDGFDPGAPATMYRDPKSSGRHRQVRRLLQLEDPTSVKDLTVCSIGELLLGLGAEVTPRPGCAAASVRLDAVDLVELAVEAALRKELTTIDELAALLRTAPANRPGRAVLQLVLAQRPPGAPPTGTYLETRCVQVLRAAGLPDFERQVEVCDTAGRIGFVDLALGGVVIEVVGQTWHLDRFDPDHRRYARLTAAGYRLLPFTFTDIEHRPRHVVAATKTALRLARV